MKRAPVLVALALLVGCAKEDPTELVVVVYSNIPIPAEMDGLRVRAARLGASGDVLGMDEARSDLGSASDLPRWVVLSHEGGPLGPVDITAEGLFHDTAVVAARARTSFVQGKRLVVPLRLLRMCAGIDCGADMTCTAGGCAPIDVDPATLAEWPGALDRLDGSVPPSGCTGAASCPDPPANAVATCVDGDCGWECREGFEDCDGDETNGCEINVHDPSTCGSCATACPDPPAATPTCPDGLCGFVCEEGRADCNATASDGCETDLASPSSCGGCGIACSGATPRCGLNPTTGARVCTSACGTVAPVDCGGSCVDTDADPDHCGTCFFACPERPNATRTCDAMVCGYECMAGYGDCDGLAENGCETSLATLTSCGGCGVPCSTARATATCAAGTCEIGTCDADYADCDSDPSNGCETSLLTPAACGGCAISCSRPNAVVSCAVGTCMLVECMPGYADCNANELDGCEASLTTLTDCGACGTTCALANAGETCASGACEIAACDTGYGDCDGAVDTGCETSLRTMTDCGSCGAGCSLAHATETCGTGACDIMACDAGWADCNGNAADGCEANLGSATTCRDCGTQCNGGTPVCDPSTGCVSGCRPMETRCGDSCVDTATDETHCGACGAACSTSHALPTCTAGACTLACDTGWADCNGNVADGCETALTTLTDCGTCGTACSRTNGTASCATGTCTLTGCDAGYGNCDMVGSNGCEASLSTLADCGSCGAVCDLTNASESCPGGTCTLGTCTTGFDDCDGLSGNGCETSLRTLASCGTCGTTCDLPNAAESCTTGTCELSSCNGGFGNCDGNVGNGCETPLTTVTDCGMCGSTCSLSRAMASCTGGTCTVGSCSTNWGDCDGTAGNGCETDLRTSDANCGTCGTSCAFPEVCSSSACGCAPSCDCVQTACSGSTPCTCDPGCDCELTCADSCQATCTGSGAVCTIEAQVGRAQRLRCLSGATCTVDARGVAHLGDNGTSPMECDGSGTTCSVDCHNLGGTTTGTCELDCTDGAACSLACQPSSTTCRITTCTDATGGTVMPTSCGGGRWVCNRSC